MTQREFNQVIEASHRVWQEFVKGDAQPAERLYSKSEDVTLANPFGGIARGWDEVSKKLSAAAANWRNGEVLGFENVQTAVSGDFAYLVEIERYRAQIGSSETAAEIGLRVTSVFRREDGDWKLVHRHADTRTGPQAAESVVA